MEKNDQDPFGGLETFRNIEDWAYIISSLSSLFFSAYYVNLEMGTFRTVTQLSQAGDVLGDEVNYEAALGIYASHFVHPDDREEYLSTMSLQNLQSSLRWWQPRVEFEYRKLSKEPDAGSGDWSRVRALAVLARRGEDDLPKTAVYVEQDITEGRQV